MRKVYVPVRTMLHEGSVLFAFACRLRVGWRYVEECGWALQPYEGFAAAAGVDLS